METTKLLRISQETHNRLTIQAALEHKQMSEIANKILLENLKDYKITENYSK